MYGFGLLDRVILGDVGVKLARYPTEYHLFHVV